MKKLYFASLSYLILGLAAGVFYREFTKANGFPESGETQLSVVHTHLLSLGFLLMLLLLVLEKQFKMSSQGLFTPAFWLFNAGLVSASAMMVWHGAYTVLGLEFGPALSGIAGLGHIVMSLGLLGFMGALGSALFAKDSAQQEQ